MVDPLNSEGAVQAHAKTFAVLGGPTRLTLLPLSREDDA
jgi:hypothetical protein